MKVFRKYTKFRRKRLVVESEGEESGGQGFGSYEINMNLAE